jgi:1-acyl-sn-glycerol-3-phosphate acyltransferase
MIGIANLVRLSLAFAWTAILGLPMLAVIYGRYAYGLARERLGRADVLDRVLDANARLAGWVAQVPWTSILLRLAGVRLRASELLKIDWSKPHVICANHTSIFDILALVRTVPPPFRFVAKRELLKWPIIGWALRPAGQIVIDRGDRAQAIKSMAEAAMRKIQGQVIFFVEGTRSRNGSLQPFKKGAFHFAIENRLPVLPVAIRGSYEVLARLPWWKMRPGRELEILFCPPIEAPPSSDADGLGAQVELLRDETRTAIAVALDAGHA